MEVKDCSIKFLDTYGSTWDSLRLINAAIYFVITIIGLIGLFSSLPQFRRAKNSQNRKGQTSSVPVINVKPMVLGALSLLALFRLIYNAVDPRNQRGYLPPLLNTTLYGSFWWLALFAYVAILFHWIDLYNISISTLKKEDMMQKINQNYKGKDITLEDMIVKVKFLKKLTIPFIILVTTIFVFETVKNVINSFPALRTSELGIVFFVYNSVNWLCLSLGFLIYGRRLLNLMPPQLFKKIRKLTRKITALSILILIVMLILYIVFNPGVGVYNREPNLYILNFVLVELSIAILTFASMSVFFKWNRKFPFFFTSSTQSSAGRAFESETTEVPSKTEYSSSSFLELKSIP